MSSVLDSCASHKFSLENANDCLKGRIIEISLADLNKDEEQAFRKIKLRIEIQGKLRARIASPTSTEWTSRLTNSDRLFATDGYLSQTLRRRELKSH